MLKYLQPIQVPDAWDIIKFTAAKADNIKEEYYEVYFNNLLQDLLSGKKSCMLGYLDKEIISCLIYSINIETTAGIKYLMLNNLYAFKKMSNEHWKNMWDDMNKVAKAQDCQVIACNTTNPRIEEMFTFFGAELYTKTFYKYI